MFSLRGELRPEPGRESGKERVDDFGEDEAEELWRA